MATGLLYGEPSGYSIGSRPERRGVDRGGRPILLDHERRYLTAAQLKEFDRRVRDHEKWIEETEKYETKRHAEECRLHDLRVDKARALYDADYQFVKKNMPLLRYFEACGWIPPGSSDLKEKLTEIATERIPPEDHDG